MKSREKFNLLMMCGRIKLIHRDSPFRFMCGNLILIQEKLLWIFYFLRCATSLYNLPKQKNIIDCFTAHVAIAAWAFLYTEICNSVYTNKLCSKNNMQILHFSLTKKLLAEIIKKH